MEAHMCQSMLIVFLYDQFVNEREEQMSVYSRWRVVLTY